MRVRHHIARSWAFLLTRQGLIALGITVVIVGLGGWFLGRSTAPVVDDSVKVKEVTLGNVGAISGSQNPIPVSGIVSSESEATLRAQAAGEITSVNYKLGAFVPAGGIIAQIENSSERAELLRAQGALDSARAQYAKTQKSDVISGQSVVAAQSAFENAVKNAYITSDDAIRNKTDQFFDSPRSVLPKIKPAFKDSDLEKEINSQRQLVEELLTSWQESFGEQILLENRAAVFEDTKHRLDTIEQFLNLLSLAVNKFEPLPDMTQGQVDGYKAATAAARGSVSGAQSALSGAYNGLNAQLAQSSGATNSGGSEDVLIASGNLKQAQAAVLSAQSNYEKTLIRAPFAGTLNALYVERGNLVNPSEEAAVVANNKTLEIKTSVTEDERRQIALGGKAMIEGKFEGTITEIAPALDPRTGKIEVSVAVPEGVALSNGENVSILLNRVIQTSQDDQVTVPLTAVKIEPTRSAVFTVVDGKLVAHEIQTGAILGDRILVLSGVTADMNIVLDARGLREGAEVTVAQ